MKIPFTGGCSCGAIRYESTAEPIMMFKCHCRDCQQGTGSGFAPGMLLPRTAFRLTRGQLRYHFTPSIRRGKHKRGFCPECGSRFRNSSSTRRYQKNRDTNFTNRHELIRIDSTVLRFVTIRAIRVVQMSAFTAVDADKSQTGRGIFQQLVPNVALHSS
jgi:hypothetical protein